MVVDKLVDLRRQPAAGASDRVIRLLDGRIRVIQSSPCGARDIGRVLMRTGNRRVHRHCPADLPVPISGGQQPLMDLVPGAVAGEVAVPPPHGLPWAELSRQVAPRNPAPVSVDDALHDRPRVRERAALAARSGRKERRDQRPLIIGEELEARHPSRVSARPLNLYKTRPSEGTLAGPPTFIGKFESVKRTCSH